MKKMFFAAVAFAGTMMLQSCGMVGPLAGGAYSSYTVGDNLGPNTTIGHKVGEAKADAYLGLIAIGDASYNTAAQNGGIKKISHVDVNYSTILGIISSYKTIVYGE
jgi:hypothetical protein